MDLRALGLRLNGDPSAQHVLSSLQKPQQMPTPFPCHVRNRLTGHHSGPVNALTYSSGSGSYILTGSSDRSIHLYNPTKPSSSALIQSYNAHGYEVLDIAVSFGNDKFVSVGGDKSVFLWDVGKAVTIRRWGGPGGHSARINCCAWAPRYGNFEGGGVGGEGGECLVISGSYDASVRIWDARSQNVKPLMVLSEAKDSISSVVASGHEITAGSVDGRVRTYDVRMGKVFTDVVGGSVTSVTATLQNDSVLVSTLDSTLRLFDKSDGKMLQRYGNTARAPGQEMYVNTKYRIRAALALHDTYVVSGSENGKIYVWDLLGGTVEHVLSHSDPHSEGGIDVKESRKVVGVVAFCPASNRAGGKKEWASAGGDGSVTVWGMRGEDGDG